MLLHIQQSTLGSSEDEPKTCKVNKATAGFVRCFLYCDSHTLAGQCKIGHWPAALTSFCCLRLTLLRGSVCLRNLRIGLARGKCLESPYLVGNKHWQGKRSLVGPTLSSSAAQDGARLGLMIHFVLGICFTASKACELGLRRFTA